MKRTRYIFIVLFIFILTSCFVKNNKPRVVIPIGIYESDSFKPNEKNYLYGRIEIKEITEEEYNGADGINVGIEDRTNKCVHLNFRFYNEETSEFEHYDIKDFKLSHLNNRFFWYSAILFSESNSDVLPEGIWFKSMENDILSIDLTFEDMDFGSYYIPIDKIEYNDPLPLGKFRSNDFENDPFFSFSIVEIKEISEEEYRNTNGINAIVDLSDRQKIRKYCSIDFYLYLSEEEKLVQYEIRYLYYLISNSDYFGGLYDIAKNDYFTSLELKCDTQEKYAFYMKFYHTEAYFTRIEENE